MDDALLNCMTGVCCPAPAQSAALAKQMLKEGLCSEVDEAHRIAAWFVAQFDLAQKGALRPLVESILRLSNA